MHVLGVDTVIRPDNQDLASGESNEVQPTDLIKSHI